MPNNSQLHSTGVPFAPRTPPFEDAATYVRARVQGGSPGGRHRVEVIVDASADAVTATVGRWAEVEPLTDVTCRMSMETDSLDGPLFALGSIGADFTVIAPPGLATMAAEWGTRFIRQATPQSSS